MTDQLPLLARLRAGYIRPIATPTEFKEAADEIESLRTRLDDALYAIRTLRDFVPEDVWNDYWMKRWERNPNNTDALRNLTDGQ